jgi:Lrp/AsnC family leucine-responsive transcriptional regulator
MKKFHRSVVIADEPSGATLGAGLDRIDRKILNILQQDNQITNIALAEQVGISPPPCFRRVKRLRDLGIIECHT